jgi:hypothetical protein
MPVLIKVSVAATGDSATTSVTAELSSDPGWYAFEVSKLVTHSYKKAFDYLIGLMDRRVINGS